MSRKLKHYRVMKGLLTATTGLRIGGSSESLEIGNVDNPVIRNPITGYPYVPGSSLKGKVRSLLEAKYGRVNYRTDNNGNKKSVDLGEPCMCGKGDCLVCRIFGPHKLVRHSLGPSRALFRDGNLTQKWQDKLEEIRAETGMFFAEVKQENIIDRRTGVAAERGLRTQERVPAGAEFEFEISVRVFDDDNEQEIIDFLKEGLTLLEQDYLGGSGTRGYGKVKLDYKVLDPKAE